MPAPYVQLGQAVNSVKKHCRNQSHLKYGCDV